MSGLSAAAKAVRPTRGAARGIAGVLRDTPNTRPARVDPQTFVSDLAGGWGDSVLEAFDYGDLRSALRGVDKPDSRHTMLMVDMNDARRALPSDYRNRGPVDPEKRFKVPRAKLELDPDSGDFVVRMPENDFTVAEYTERLYGLGQYQGRVPIVVESSDAILGTVLNSRDLSGMVRMVGPDGTFVRVPMSRTRLPGDLDRHVFARTNTNKQSVGWAEYEIDYVESRSATRAGDTLEGEKMWQEYEWALHTTRQINQQVSNPVEVLQDAMRRKGFPSDLVVLGNKVSKAMQSMANSGFEFTVSVPHPRSQRALLNTRYQNALGLSTYHSSAGRVDIELRHPKRWEAQGTTPETMMHEYVHAVTQTSLDHARSANAPAPLREAADELETILGIAKAEVNNIHLGTSSIRVSDEVMLTVTQANTLDDIHELVAWATTNREARQFLAQISAPGVPQTLWDRLVHAISRILGIDAPEKSALERVLIRSNELLDFAEDGGAFKLYEQDWLDTYGSLGGSL